MVTLNTLALVFALAGNGETVLLEFTSQSCTHCQTMEPTLGRLTRDGYPVQKIDVAERQELAARFHVTGVPCFVMLADGREVDRVVGACSYARLVQMFAAAQPQSAPSNPIRLASSLGDDTIRAQSPESTLVAIASTQASTTDPRRTAFDATIRLRIEDATGHSVGTGTIVDTHGDEALAITCGHIFRDSGGQGRVLVDLFPGGQLQTVEGTLISYDLTRDIGLVSFVPGFAVAPVQIAPAGHRFTSGDTVFSVGCDNGREPSIRDTRITSIDRYLGPPNIEAAGEPAQGRSGGGLFSQDGFLIGICNHGDPRDDEGIYASLPTIHWELDRVGQRRLYQPNAEALAMQGLSPSRLDPSRATAEPDASARTTSPVAMASAALQDVAADALAPSDTEVICIVRSRNNPEAEERVYILNQPSTEFLDRLTRESRSVMGTSQIATRDVPRVASNPNAIRASAPGEPVVRAQSDDGR